MASSTHYVSASQEVKQDERPKVSVPSPFGTSGKNNAPPPHVLHQVSLTQAPMVDNRRRRSSSNKNPDDSPYPFYQNVPIVDDAVLFPPAERPRTSGVPSRALQTTRRLSQQSYLLAQARASTAGEATTLNDILFFNNGAPANPSSGSRMSSTAGLSTVRRLSTRRRARLEVGSPVLARRVSDEMRRLRREAEQLRGHGRRPTGKGNGQESEPGAVPHRGSVPGVDLGACAAEGTVPLCQCVVALWMSNVSVVRIRGGTGGLEGIPGVVEVNTARESVVSSQPSMGSLPAEARRLMHEAHADLTRRYSSDRYADVHVCVCVRVATCCVCMCRPKQRLREGRATVHLGSCMIGCFVYLCCNAVPRHCGPVCVYLPVDPPVDPPVDLPACMMTALLPQLQQHRAA